MVVGGGLRMAAVGMAVGAVALSGSVVLLARALDIRDVTWVPFALSIGVVAFISVAASYVPAWRASLLSPMVAHLATSRLARGRRCADVSGAR